MLAPDQLGPDLEALVAGIDAPLRHVATLTTLRAPAVTHASFRLEFSDGRVLKGRRVGSAAHAMRMTALLAPMDRRHFPRVIAQRGAALLEEWVPGVALAATGTDPALVRWCGTLLGAVHVVELPPGMEPEDRSTPAARLARLEQQVASLGRLAVLSRALRMGVMELARASAPTEATLGIIHGDFCGDNVVTDEAGRPHIIDNETMQVGALDFDLARTWYRWPDAVSQTGAFLEGYAVHRSPTTYLRHFRFWVLSVLVDATWFHLRLGTAQAPLKRLVAFLDDVRPAPAGSGFPARP
jgi:streptomycin 6-kinase